MTTPSTPITNAAVIAQLREDAEPGQGLFTNAPGDGSPLVPPSYRPASPPPSTMTPCTRAFYEKNLLEMNQQLNDGFYDCGRSVPTLPSLNALRAQAAHNGREVIILDTATDPDLCCTLEKIYATLSHVPDVRAKVQCLCLLVSNFYGGVNTDLIHNTEQGILNLKQKLKTNVLPIGKLQYGVCRHRAVVFKYVCDHINIPCRLVRGDYISDKGTEGHAWNVVFLNNTYYLCDIMHDPGTLFEEHSQKAEHYKRITKTAGVMSYAGGPGMQSLPMPLHMNHRADETREQKLERMVYALQEEVAIKGLQLEKLATKLLEASPSIL